MTQDLELTMDDMAEMDRPGMTPLSDADLDFSSSLSSFLSPSPSPHPPPPPPLAAPISPETPPTDASPPRPRRFFTASGETALNSLAMVRSKRAAAP